MSLTTRASRVLDAWDEGLVPSDLPRRWAESELRAIADPGSIPTWLLDLAQRGPEAIGDEPMAWRAPRDLQALFAFAASAVDLADDASVEGFAGWLAHAARGHDLSLPEVRLGDLVGHELNHRHDLDGAARGVREGLPPLLDACRATVAGILGSVPLCAPDADEVDDPQVVVLLEFRGLDRSTRIARHAHALAWSWLAGFVGAGCVWEFILCVPREISTGSHAALAPTVRHLGGAGGVVAALVSILSLTRVTPGVLTLAPVAAATVGCLVGIFDWRAAVVAYLLVLAGMPLTWTPVRVAASGRATAPLP